MTTPRLYFLLFTADGADGICRSVITLANGLADRYRIELISLYRRRAELAYDLDPRVGVTNLHDARPVGPKGNRYGGRVRIRDYPERNADEAALDAQPSRLVRPDADPHMSLLTDTLLAQKLRDLQPGVLVSTRPSLHAAAVAFGPDHLIKVAQDHQNYETRMPALRELTISSAARMDCLVTLTGRDRQAYAAALASAHTAVEAIPNAVPWTIGPAAPLDSRIVVTGGRLVHSKGFDRLIEAYQPVARARPDWRLHIYGKGTEQERLQRLIGERGMDGQVMLMGHTDRFRDCLSGAAAFASGSHSEGFPMVMLEAMSIGLPVVSYDVPSGPADLIRDGLNGYLVADGDQPAFGAALRRIVEHAELRRQMGRAGQAMARYYQIGNIADRWSSLFDQLWMGPTDQRRLA
jgi:glycosyltransferase involved in cell wall biosynthesis